MPSLKEIVTGPGIKYLLFAGKGGLGKTTLSAITAVWLAQQGKKVVVFSTDPQASLSDIFERDIFGKGEIKLAENLYVLEIDADRKVSEYQKQIRGEIVAKYGEVPEEIDEYIKGSSAQPAMSESATFDGMMDLITKGGYDYYIFDMMPHGHAIRFLSMASLLDTWINKVVKVSEDTAEADERLKKLTGDRFKREIEEHAGVLGELQGIKGRLDFIADVIKGRDKTALFYVVIPETMAIRDTEVAIKEFKKFGIELSNVIVNQVHPSELLDDKDTPEFLRNRIKMQQENMKIIEDKFKNLIGAKVAMMDREPKGLEILSNVAKMIYGE
ncbi:MAG: TRC40/GET3/ArsA family transport-energizing ATPase [Candidatus Hydrothermarchaeota archaeon]|nr:TRC40/GET3/ArsA family transport-energizing ATPase [Candidatus Hydrothermarchaeota archaeon]